MGFEKLSFSRFLVSSRSRKHPLFLSRGNGSVRSNCVAKRSKDAARGTKGEREREKIGEKRGVPYARTIEKKLAAILAPPHGQLPTRLPLSASLPPPALPSLCVSYATASRTTTAPNKIQSRRGREGDYNSIDRGRTAGVRRLFVFKANLLRDGGISLFVPSAVSVGESRETGTIVYLFDLIIIARFVAYSRFTIIRFDRLVEGNVCKMIDEDDSILFLFF